jgi:hypothetical protein
VNILPSAACTVIFVSRAVFALFCKFVALLWTGEFDILFGHEYIISTSFIYLRDKRITVLTKNHKTRNYFNALKMKELEQKFHKVSQRPSEHYHDSLARQNTSELLEKIRFFTLPERSER